MRRATLNDIATETGFSRSTVTAVMAGKGRQFKISAPTEAAIKKAAERLGYRRNSLAAHMATGKTDYISFVSNNIGTWEFVGRMLSGILEEATARRFSLKVHQLTAANQEEIAARLLEQCVSGVVFHAESCRDIDAIRTELTRNLIPSATVNLANDGVGAGVNSDDFRGMEKAVRHLAAMGHRRIAHISDKRRREFAVIRENGFLSGMAACLPSPSSARIIRIDLHPSPGNVSHPLFERILLERPDRRPTAITCCTDHVATGLMQTAYRLGIKVPDELSIVGFSDSSVAKAAMVPLTTVAQPFEEMGRKAAQLLIDAIQKNTMGFLNSSKNVTLPVRLVFRNSTAPLKRKEPTSAQYSRQLL